jgi:polyribonucleotide nucleotidyltransferase
MEAALAQARDGRLHILGKLIETLAAQKEDVKSIRSKIITRRINAIRCLNRPGGKVIQKLQSYWNNDVINEDPTTEESEILGTDPAGIEAVLAKLNRSLSNLK